MRASNRGVGVMGGEGEKKGGADEGRGGGFSE
jgi:hypothetical protein